MASITHDLEEFTGILLKSYGELTIVPGDRHKITIEADAEVLDSVRYGVVDGTLELGVGRNFGQIVRDVFESGLDHQRITYTVTVAVLERLEVPGAAKVRGKGITGEQLRIMFRGACDVSLSEIEFGTLFVEMPGAGKLSVSGRVNEQRVVLSGAGAYQADRLESARCDVALKGVGRASVWVTELLTVTLRGIGSVEYVGDPVVEKTVKGLGSVSQLRSEP